MFNQSGITNIFRHTTVYRVIRELWTLLQDMGHIAICYGSLFFSSFEKITVNCPSDLMEFPKNSFERRSL